MCQLLGCPKTSATAPTGSVSEYCFAPFTGGSHYLEGIVSGPDGNRWFTESTHIGRITPAGAITEFALPTSNSMPEALVVGPDGNLWFIEEAAKAIGRITPQGVVTVFPLPAGDTFPVGLAAGPDGALWFDTGLMNASGLYNSWIGRMTTSGKASVIYAPDPRTLASFTGLTAGPDHNLWFTESIITGNTSGSSGKDVDRVGRLTPSGTLTLFPLSLSTNSQIVGSIVAGPDGNLWFAEEFGSTIGRITPSGQITLFPLPDSTAGVPSMAPGPGRAVWFVQTYPIDLLSQFL
jgi:streptogramin lyase